MIDVEKISFLRHFEILETFLEILLKKIIECPSEYTHKFLNIFYGYETSCYSHKLVFEIPVAEGEKV